MPHAPNSTSASAAACRRFIDSELADHGAIDNFVPQQEAKRLSEQSFPAIRNLEAAGTLALDHEAARSAATCIAILALYLAQE